MAGQPMSKFARDEVSVYNHGESDADFAVKTST